MEVILAKKAGFCWGVKRAIKIAAETAEKGEGPITALGPIIHNPQVISALRRKGVEIAKKLDDVEAGTVIIRAHGVKPEVKASAEGRGLKVVDATCPIVERNQEFARRLHQEGYLVVIIGEPNHPEVLGVMGYAEEDALVINANAADVEMNIPTNRRIGVVAQTTLNVEAFKRIVGKIVEKAKEVKVYNTICNATDQIQKATVDLTEDVDLMIVVGGRESANTGRLKTMSEELDCPAYHIETAEELKSEWFVGINRVGVTAGTSTPDWIIQAVVERLKSFDQSARQELTAS